LRRAAILLLTTLVPWRDATICGGGREWGDPANQHGGMRNGHLCMLANWFNQGGASHTGKLIRRQARHRVGSYSYASARMSSQKRFMAVSVVIGYAICWVGSVLLQCCRGCQTNLKPNKTRQDHCVSEHSTKHRRFRVRSKSRLKSVRVRHVGATHRGP
jgi:hypothetical protein